MRYMGSKAKHANELLAVIRAYLSDKNVNPSNCNWVEPFVGACNMMDKVTGFKARYGNDINVHLVELYKALQNGWIPPDSISLGEYKELQKLQDVTVKQDNSALIGFVGVGCSFGGKWFGGFARGGQNKKGIPRNYCGESKRNVLHQVKKLKEVILTSGNYSDISTPPPIGNIQ